MSKVCSKDIILEAQDIYKIYKEDTKKVEVLKDLNLQVALGEIVVIFGPSGCGKTTLIHILGGLDKPTQGKVLLGGVDIFAHSDKELSKIRNKEIGFVFQFHQLMPEFTALENVKLPTLIGRENQLTERCTLLLDAVGLKGKEHKIPPHLSGGERQRVGVARALVNNPRIVLADEPSGNLDPETSGELHNLFLKLNKEHNVTFLIATHKESLANIGSRVLKLEAGKLKEV
ncbi:MAG: ABC transporter ATP-binding protein [bacterium]|nr:ABC transporter ATP-binding protein [bacterium]